MKHGIPDPGSTTAFSYCSAGNGEAMDPHNFDTCVSCVSAEGRTDYLANCKKKSSPVLSSRGGAAPSLIPTVRRLCGPASRLRATARAWCAARLKRHPFLQHAGQHRRPGSTRWRQQLRSQHCRSRNRRRRRRPCCARPRSVRGCLRLLAQAEEPTRAGQRRGQLLQPLQSPARFRHVLPVPDPSSLAAFLARCWRVCAGSRGRDGRRPGRPVVRLQV